jgi:hypothetical protein
MVNSQTTATRGKRQRHFAVVLLGIRRGCGGAFLSRLGDAAGVDTAAFKRIQTTQSNNADATPFFLSLLTGTRLTTGTGRFVVVSVVGVHIRINMAPFHETLSLLITSNKQCFMNDPYHTHRQTH